jgi:hypothetical protein
MMSVAPRCFSFSTTNDPRKPAPPVTMTRLSRQNPTLSGQSGERDTSNVERCTITCLPRC